VPPPHVRTAPANDHDEDQMPSTQLEAKGLFAGLFDFGFTTFITLKFLRVIYIVLMALIFLGGLVFLVRGLAAGGAAAVATIVFVPLGVLLYLIVARIYMELIALFFRIGENTSIMAEHLGGRGAVGGLGGVGGPGTSTPPGGYGYGAPPQA
jgi:cellulose synthase/poly-beta-1,6-N-acetylglucosamine synthase-like glycosyltransferase